MSGTCNRLAMGTERWRSDRHALGFLVWATARMDQRTLDSLRSRSGKRTKLGELQDVNVSPFLYEI